MNLFVLNKTLRVLNLVIFRVFHPPIGIRVSLKMSKISFFNNVTQIFKKPIKSIHKSLFEIELIIKYIYLYVFKFK